MTSRPSGASAATGSSSRQSAGTGVVRSMRAWPHRHRRVFLTRLPESEAKKLLGLTDDDEEDEWD